jgi:hypothetical protein
MNGGRFAGRGNFNDGRNFQGGRFDGRHDGRFHDHNHFRNVFAFGGGGYYGDDYYPYYYNNYNNGAAYCAQRFRSYDPASGTYLGFDGRRHSCP